MCHSHTCIRAREPPLFPFERELRDLATDCDRGRIARSPGGILQRDELEKLNENIRMRP